MRIANCGLLLGLSLVMLGVLIAPHEPQYFALPADKLALQAYQDRDYWINLIVLAGAVLFIGSFAAKLHLHGHRSKLLKAPTRLGNGKITMHPYTGAIPRDTRQD